MKSAYPDVEICSRCNEHTGFEWDDFEESWVSVCCTARPISVDIGPA